MVITQQPDLLSLSGNLKKFVISSASPVSFKLMDGGTVLLDEVYEPGSLGSVSVDVRQLVERRLSYSLSGSNFYAQPNLAKLFSATIDGQSVSFRVIRSGVQNLADTPANWLRSNFLTWQPTAMEVSYYSPSWLTYFAAQSCTIKLKAYFDDDTTDTITLGTCSANQAYTANVQYAVVAGLLDQKYPTHYDVWVEGSGSPLTYTQRYFYGLPKSELEQWVLFENSLGGLDTLRASGATSFSGEHSFSHSVIDGTSTEFDIDTQRIYTQHTGALDEYQRLWLKDLFPAHRKYVHHNGAIRPIVLTETDAQFTNADFASGFSFSFRFADDSRGLLNLIRNEGAIPDAITLPNLSAPNFLIPPRLSELPRVQLAEGVILPAFDPHSDSPKITTVGALIASAVSEALASIPGGDGSAGGGGQLVNIIREHALSAGSDNDVFSSLRTKKEIALAIQEFADSIDEYLGDFDEQFLSKIKPDQTEFLIKFLKGIEIGEFTPGMFGGTGARIDEFGNAEVTSLKARGFIEAPEYRFNRLTVVGDEILLTENGIIEALEELAPNVFKLTLRLEEGEVIAFKEHDLIKGIFHYGFSFSTSYLIVTEVGQTFIKVQVANDTDVPTQQNFPPRQFMKMARCGNLYDPERQRYMSLSSKDGGWVVYDGASTFLNGQPVMEASVAQKFKHLYDNLPLKEGLTYMYAAGLVVQDIIRVDYQGVTVREIYDRGPWQPGVTYYNNDIQGTDDVWHLGCRWRCFSSSTTDEPSWTSASWAMIEGRSDARMEFDSSNGFAFFAGMVDTVITPVVFIGNTNVSSDIVEEQWSWTRQSGSQVSDDIWNAQHVGQRLLHLQNEDMSSRWSRSNPVKFTCTATYPANVINQISSYIEV